MAQIGAPGAEVPIGEIVDPPFARMPDPLVLFGSRAARFAALATDHQLGPYLTFLGHIAEIQANILPALPEPQLPPPDALARSREFAMPPLDRSRFPDEPACRETLRRFFAGAGGVEMPAEARETFEELSKAEDDMLSWMAKNVVADAIPAHEAAAHVLVAAGLQVHAARAASRLDATSLVPVGDGVCPACGGPPTASLVVGWESANGARFCSCSLCSTLWHYVRIRCIACGSTKGISYQELEGGRDGAIKAECCQECRTFSKVMQQAKHPELDPVADDVATLALDMLLKEDDFRRSGQNPFLLGY